MKSQWGADLKINLDSLSAAPAVRNIINIRVEVKTGKTTFSISYRIVNF
jgi:hypothetical protein